MHKKMKKGQENAPPVIEKRNRGAQINQCWALWSQDSYKRCNRPRGTRAAPMLQWKKILTVDLNRSGDDRDMSWRAQNFLVRNVERKESCRLSREKKKRKLGAFHGPVMRKGRGKRLAL